jgi:ABC-type transporter Mla maintaining outer membrane lipid asymmetry ATPase subunit MlaF
VTADPIVLDCGAGTAPLRIAPGSGATYRVSASGAAACNRLVREALRHPQAELVPRSGGLLVNLSVLENVLLPAVYHRRVAGRDLAALVYREFEACGLERAQADALCEREVPALNAFERRLVALVRSLLMRPALLLMERIFEGLTARDMERVARFGAYYRHAVAGGTLLLIDLAGMPCPDVDADFRAEAE